MTVTGERVKDGRREAGRGARRDLAPRRPAVDAERDLDTDLLLALAQHEDALGHPGRPLDPDVAASMERALGHDFSSVRIHTDELAGELTAAVDAEAFTIGRHIWFAPGRFAPMDPAGRRLLAHELAHTTQARDVPHAPADVGDATVAIAPGIERAADIAADGVDADGEMARVVETAAPAPAIFRRESPAGARQGSTREKTAVGDALARLVERLLRRDPQDRSGRIRGMMQRLAPKTRAGLLERIRARNGTAMWEGITALLERRDESHDAAATAPSEVDGERHLTEADGEREPRDQAGEPAPSESVTADVVQPATGLAGMFAGLASALGRAIGAIGEVVGARVRAPIAGPEDAEAIAPTEDRAPAGGPGVATVDEGDREQAPARSELEGGTRAGADDAASAETVAQQAGGPEAAEDAGAGADGSAARTAFGAGAPPAPAEGGGAGAAEAETGAALENAAPEPRDDTEPAPHAAGPEVETDAVPDGGPAAAESADAVPPMVEAGGTGMPTSDAPAAAPDMGAVPEPSGDAPVPAASAEAEVPAPAAVPEPVAAETDVATEAHEAPAATAAEAAGGDPEAGAETGVAPAAGETGDVGGEATKPECKTAPKEQDLDDTPSEGGPCATGGEVAPAAAPEAAPVPDVSGAAPAAAMRAVAKMKPTAMTTGLGGVRAAADREIGADRAHLAEAPPSVERPSGVPADRDATVPPRTLPPLPHAAPGEWEKLPKAPSVAALLPAVPPPAPAPPTNAVPPVRLAGEAPITDADAERVQDAVHALPTTDPALAIDAGPIPKLRLEGDAEPERVVRQQASLVRTVTDAHRAGVEAARADAGERDVYPTVPKETLRATLDAAAAPPKTAGAPAPAAPVNAAPAGAAAPMVLDAFAREKNGTEIDAALQRQAPAMEAARTDHDEQADKAAADAHRDLDQAVDDNANQQAAVRRDVATSTDTQRKAWVGEQTDLVTTAHTGSDAAGSKADTDVRTATTDAADKAEGHITDGNTKIETERTDAEHKAQVERAKAEREADSGGFFSWLGSKVTAFFDSVKAAIKGVFDDARKAVGALVKAAQEAAVAAIELGRKAVVGAIEVAGTALLAAGDVALAGFPKLRASYRATIEKGVAIARDTVNTLADGLKKAAVAIIDAWGKVLTAALSVLEKLYLAAVDLVKGVVDSAIKAAKAVVAMYADFGVIIADIAADPVGWLKKLGTGVMEGVKKCTWPALKVAVKHWFREKVEEVVGVGKVVLDVLVRGCISFATVVKMAWAAIKESLPGIVIQLLIEKLVAMLIPAGGALSLIIDGIKAAWGAAARVFAAVQKFVAFLKAVRPGQAAGAFGVLVGAGATAVLDFVANFVLAKLKGAGSKVGGALKKMAAAIMGGLKKAAGAVKRLVVRGAKALARTRVVRAVVAGAAAVGRGAKKLATKAKAAWNKTTQRFKRKGGSKAKPHLAHETPQQKLNRVVGIIKPTIEGWLSRGISRPMLWLRLAYLKVRHRLTSLRAVRHGARLTLVAKVNPEQPVASAWPLSDDERLRRIVHEIGEEMMNRPDVLARAEGQGRKQESIEGFRADQRANKKLEGPRDAVHVDSGADFVASATRFRNTPHRLWGVSYTMTVAGAGVVEVTRMFGSAVARFVAKMGRYGASVVRGRKPGEKLIGDRLRDIGAKLGSGGGEKDAAQTVLNLIAAGKIPPGLEADAHEVAKIAVLMTSVEGARSPGALGFTPMSLDLIARGEATSHEMFEGKAKSSGGGGLYPPSMQRIGSRAGAEKAARELEEERKTDRDPTNRSEGAMELAAREIALIKRWLHARLGVEQPVFRDGDDSEVRQYIRAEMEQFYRLPALEAAVKKGA